MTSSLLLLSSAPSDKDIKRGQALKEEGNALVKKGEHKKAIEKYSESLKRNPTEVTTYTNRWVHFNLCGAMLLTGCLTLSLHLKRA